MKKCSNLTFHFIYVILINFVYVYKLNNLKFRGDGRITQSQSTFDFDLDINLSQNYFKNGFSYSSLMNKIIFPQFDPWNKELLINFHDSANIIKFKDQFYYDFCYSAQNAFLHISNPNSFRDNFYYFISEVDEYSKETCQTQSFAKIINYKFNIYSQLVKKEKFDLYNKKEINFIKENTCTNCKLFQTIHSIYLPKSKKIMTWTQIGNNYVLKIFDFNLNDLYENQIIIFNDKHPNISLFSSNFNQILFKEDEKTFYFYSSSFVIIIDIGNVKNNYSLNLFVRILTTVPNSKILFLKDNLRALVNIKTEKRVNNINTDLIINCQNIDEPGTYSYNLALDFVLEANVEVNEINFVNNFFLIMIDSKIIIAKLQNGSINSFYLWKTIDLFRYVRRSTLSNNILKIWKLLNLSKNNYDLNYHFIGVIENKIVTRQISFSDCFYYTANPFRCSDKCYPAEVVSEETKNCGSNKNCYNDLFKNGENCDINCPTPYYLEINGNKICLGLNFCPDGYYNLQIENNKILCTETCPKDYVIDTTRTYCINSFSCNLIYNLNCVDECPSQFAIKDESNNFYKVNICLEDSECPANYCISTNEETITNLCSTNCENNNINYSDDYKINCKTKYFYESTCVEECPQFTIIEYSEFSEVIKCVNCKSIGKIYFDDNCYDTPPNTSILVNSEFNQYKSCQDVGMIIDNDQCVSRCQELSIENKEQNYCLTPWEYILPDPIEYFVVNQSKPNNIQNPPITPTTTLEECLKQGQFLYNQKCISKCPDGYYSDKNLCLSCVSYSISKSDYLKKCKCKDQKLLQYLDLCVISCPNGYFADKLNETCIQCTSYNSLTESGCSCKSRGLLLLNNKCLSECPKNFYADSENTCKDCNISKQTDSLYIKNCCSTSNQILNNDCKACFDKKQFLLNGNCVNACPYNAAVDFTNGLCTICKDIGKYLGINECVTSCGVGSRINQQDKICNFECTLKCPDNSCYFTNGVEACQCTNKMYGKFCDLEIDYIGNGTKISNDTITAINQEITNSSLNSTATSSLIDSLFGSLTFIKDNNVTFFNDIKNLAVDLTLSITKIFSDNLGSNIDKSNVTVKPTSNVFGLLDSTLQSVQANNASNNVVGNLTNAVSDITNKITITNIKDTETNNCVNFTYTSFKITVYDPSAEKSGSCLQDTSFSSLKINDECIQKVRTFLNLKENDILPIKKIEYNLVRNDTESPLVKFAIVNPLSGNDTNLGDICIETTSIYIATVITVAEVRNYNRSDPYFTDDCLDMFDGVQLPRKIRAKEFKNVTFQCNEGCQYRGLLKQGDVISVACECLPVATSAQFSMIEDATDRLVDSIFSNNNLVLLKCYKKAFNQDILKLSYAFYTGLIIGGSILIFVILYWRFLTPNLKDINKFDRQKFHNKLSLGEFIEDLYYNNPDIQRPLFSHYFSVNDIEAMSSTDLLEYDDREWYQYLWDCFYQHHSLFVPFLINSVSRPRFISVMLLLLRISAYLGFSAVIYTDQWVEMKANNSEQIGDLSFLIFSNINNKVFNLLLCSISFLPIDLILSFTKKDLVKKLNEKLNRKDDKEKVLGVLEFNKKMRYIYVFVISYAIILHLFMWYQTICFCGVYPDSCFTWFKNGIITCFIYDQILNFIKPLLTLIFWWTYRRYEFGRKASIVLFQLAYLFLGKAA